jgi:hypothetical protein
VVDVPPVPDDVPPAPVPPPHCVTGTHASVCSPSDVAIGMHIDPVAHAPIGHTGRQKASAASASCAHTFPVAHSVVAAHCEQLPPGVAPPAEPAAPAAAPPFPA